MYINLAGDNVGLLLRGIKLQTVIRGMMLCASGSEKCVNHFLAKVYFLSIAEGGRKKPVISNYTQQLFSRTWNIACRLDLIGEEQTMIMPGEHATVRMLLLKGMVLTMGQQFTLRENNKTVATGIVTKVLPNIPVRKGLGKVKLEEFSVSVS